MSKFYKQEQALKGGLSYDAFMSSCSALLHGGQRTLIS